MHLLQVILELYIVIAISALSEADNKPDGTNCDDEVEQPTPAPPPPNCETQERIDEITKEIGMIRLAMKGLLTECPEMDQELEIDCECTEVNEFYRVAVTSEGGAFGINPAESLTQNRTGLFMVDGNPVRDAPNWLRGLNFVVVQRATKEVTLKRRFDIFDDNSLADNCTSFIRDEIPLDSVVLVSASQSVVGQMHKLPKLWQELSNIGAVKRFKVFDSYALVGFKRQPGLCDRVPSFITEAYAASPGKNGRDQQWTAPVTAYADIPTHCEPYTTDIDFEVRLISEADVLSSQVEYQEDAPNTSLFYVNGKRLLGAPWWRGLNVVVLDPASRVAKHSAYFDVLKISTASDDFVSYIDAQTEGSVILITLWGRGNRVPNTNALDTLRELGADFTATKNNGLRIGDTFSLVGYKGYCGNSQKPTWVRQNIGYNPGNSRGSLKSEVLETISLVTIPLCS